MVSKAKALIASTLLTILLLYFLLSQLDLRLLFNTLLNLNPIYVFLGFLCYLTTYLFRTTRFYVLLNKSIPFSELFKVVCVHNMFNNLLPARTGEVSFLYLLKKFHGRNLGEAVAVLVVARFFDMLSILTFFLISAIFVKSVSINKFLIASLIFILLLIFLLVIFSRKRILNALDFFQAKFDSKIVKNILRVFRDTITEFESVKNLKIIVLSALFSFCMWFFLYLTAFLILLSMSIYIEFASAIFASTFPVVTTLLPIQGFVGFGTIEAGWAIGFSIVGIPLEIAVLYGLVWHFIVIIYYLIPGIVAMAKMHSSKG
ncbi:MAG TPA: hypothetical protein DER56_04520 [Thermosipho africanus]|uniref:Uncharacterized protein n=1 Tax=Thermococcus sibiricus TaxID=172049 RepID=A0A101EL14_9EURY|nr:lysylphosphatidylglycerol synthase transmembrane domain-containing protein [Thermococcus sibiricus]KUK16860.1 MAG: hypothetical protein XD54_1843 [Thermococcus sibiricus]HCF38326.1 hypothetical protein [Thermosipho africanus]